MQRWLVKSEPNAFSVDDLAREPDQTTPWEGVRNFQARNFMRAMKRGDHVFFYHSSCSEPGVVGVTRVVREAYPDDTAWDAKSRYFDARSTCDKPRWYRVDIQLKHKLRRVIRLAELKQQSLGDFALTRRGNRLSVMPVSEEQWKQVLSLE